MPHIEVRNVSLAYDTPAGRVTGVEAASFDIEQSEFLCLVGPSGCGKIDAAEHHRRLSQRPRAARSASAASRSPATAWTAASCSRTLRSFFPGAPRLAMSTFGLEMKGVGKAEREEIAQQAAQAREAREIRAGLSASSVRRHAAAGRHRAGACVQSGGAADGRAVRRARRAHPRRDAAPARRCLARNQEDRGLRDAQRGGSGLSRGPGGGDEPASRHREDRSPDHAGTAARPAQRRVPRLPEQLLRHLGQEARPIPAPA